MLIKKVKYTDYFGKEQEEELMFNLSKPEIIRMETSYEGGLEAHISRFVANKDSQAIMEMFEDLIRRSYGVRSEDGKRFIKDEATVSGFVDSAAYEALYEELLMDADKASKFFLAVIPAAPAEN